jgi:signal transduction histidine kinase
MKNLSAYIKEMTSGPTPHENPCFLLIDEAGNIQFINAHLVKRLDLNNENIAGSNIFTFLLPADHEMFKNILASIKNNDIRTSVQIPIKNGGLYLMSWEITRIASLGKFMCIGYEQPTPALSTQHISHYNIPVTISKAFQQTDDALIEMVSSSKKIDELQEMEALLAEEETLHQKKLADAIVKAQEKERINLGIELHDNVNQVLTIAKLYLDMIKSTNTEDSLLLEKAKGFISDSINGIRDISKTMVLPQLKESSLAESINELVKEIKLSGAYDIDFSYKDSKAKDLTQGKKITLFRIIQEQIKNIIKHSQAKNIIVKLGITATEAALAIEDNGVGFDVTKKRKGIGLSNIRERVELYKGIMELTSTPGEGCRLHVTIPL